jgi:hypothetical protein
MCAVLARTRQARVVRPPTAALLTTPQEIVTLHVVHWGYKNLKAGLGTRRLPLVAVPSVRAALVAKDSQPISWETGHDGEAANALKPSFSDWEAQVQAHGAKCFLVCSCVVGPPQKHPHVEDWLGLGNSHRVLSVGKELSSSSKSPTKPQALPMLHVGQRIGVLCLSGVQPGCLRAEQDLAAQCAGLLSQLLWACRVQHEKIAGGWVSAYNAPHGHAA